MDPSYFNFFSEAWQKRLFGYQRICLIVAGCIFILQAVQRSSRFRPLLFSSGIITVAFRFRAVNHRLMAFFIVPFTLFYSDQHPFGFFIDASA